MFEQNAVDGRAAVGEAGAGAVPRRRRRLPARARRAALAAAGAEQLAQTQLAVATNLIALYKALGGGWEVRAGPARRAASTTQREMQERTNWGDMLSQPRQPEHANSLADRRKH